MSFDLELTDLRALVTGGTKGVGAAVVGGGTIVVTGGTTGMDVRLSLLPMISEQITVCGSIMGTLQDMKNMIAFISSSGIAPEIGKVLPMERAEEAFRAM